MDSFLAVLNAPVWIYQKTRSVIAMLFSRWENEADGTDNFE